MAKRLIFEVGDGSEIYIEKIIEFKYYNGFSISQRQKSIHSLHENIKKIYGKEKQILEISSKSPQEIGRKLSAFNLNIRYKGKDISLENIFQSSKVFEKGGPYLDLLYVSPVEAKKDIRIRESGDIIGFKFNNKGYPNEPKTLFYDWIYCQTLNMKNEYLDQILKFSIFSDIEFNHEKSMNCQARSVAIFVSLYKKNLLRNALNSICEFTKIVYGKRLENISNIEQLKFDFYS